MRIKHIHTYEEFLNEARLNEDKLIYGHGGIGTDQKALEYLWKIGNYQPPHFFEEPNEETNKSKKEELLKRLGLLSDAHQTEKEALRTGEYFLEMWRKEKNMKYDKKKVFESLINEAEMEISGLAYHQWNDKQAQRELKDVKIKIIGDSKNILTISGEEKELDKVRSIFGIK